MKNYRQTKQIRQENFEAFQEQVRQEDGNQADAPPKDRALRHDRQNFANNPSVREHYLRVYPWAEYYTSEHERWEALMSHKRSTTTQPRGVISSTCVFAVVAIMC
eukprot:PhM_4_TR13973/c4_g2_i2/m.36069